MTTQQKGWKGKAIDHYKKFFSLWKNADPGIAEVEDKIHEQTRQKVDTPTEEVGIKRAANHLKSVH